MARSVFGFLAFTSGAYEGAIIRDMRLANALRRRGFEVFVYWMMEQNRELVDARIGQRIACSGMRYVFNRPSGLMDAAGRILNIVPLARRRRFVREHPDFSTRIMSNCCRAICDGDGGLSRRLAKLIARDGVTHLLPTFAMICPFAQAARQARQGASSFDYLVTFQGEEIFANFAQRIDRLKDYHLRLRQTVAASPWPAIAVSKDYIQRLAGEMAIDPAGLRAIYPGIEPPPVVPATAEADFATLKGIFPSLRPDVPIVAYLGRQDAEKGIDLLLYAVRMLKERGVEAQLLCVGDSSFGMHYRRTLEQIAEHLRLNVFWKRRVSSEMRNALYRASRCIVYPAIHREPFGMVAAEAMSHGTPVLVPDQGGITEVIEVDGLRGGLTFRAWDSHDLADQLNRLLGDEILHAELAGNTRTIAANFSVERMTDRVLEHLGIEAMGQ